MQGKFEDLRQMGRCWRREHGAVRCLLTAQASVGLRRRVNVCGCLFGKVVL